MRALLVTRERVGPCGKPRENFAFSELVVLLGELAINGTKKNLD
jgi:hypothetical protein